MTPGIHTGISSADYHAGEGVSKTGLWTLYRKTPAHFRFGERKDTNAFDLGTAAHIAVLEPERLERDVVCGPEDRRGNRWKDAELAASAQGALLLTASDFERALMIRDSAERSSTIRTVRKSAIIEASGYAVDPETGVLCRCRPDAYNAELAIILDLKTAVAGGSFEFSRAAEKFGYHMQEAFYTDVWNHTCDALEKGDEPVGLPPAVDAFVFAVIEKEKPFLVSTYELSPGAVEEGRAAYRQALALYAQCQEREHLGMPAEKAWPGYPDEPGKLDLPRYGYRLTAPPEGDE